MNHIDDTQFTTHVLQANQPVLVDFWAPWCAPCKLITPLLEEAEEDYAGRLQIVKLNIDTNPVTPAQLGVRGVPTLVLFKHGQAVARLNGAVSRTRFVAFLDQAL